MSLAERLRPFLKPIEATLYRSIPARFHETPLHFESSLIGGRYNPPNSFVAYYTSFEDETAQAEAKQSKRMTGSRTLFPVKTKVERSLDLTNEAVLDVLGVTQNELSMSWQPYNLENQTAPTQRLAESIFELGTEAIIAESVRRPGYKNVVFYPENFGEASYLQIADDTGFIVDRFPSLDI